MGLHVRGGLHVDLRVKAIEGLNHSGFEQNQAVFGLLNFAKELIDFSDFKMAIANCEGVNHEGLIRRGGRIFLSLLPIRQANDSETLGVLEVHYLACNSN